MTRGLTTPFIVSGFRSKSAYLAAFLIVSPPSSSTSNKIEDTEEDEQKRRDKETAKISRRLKLIQEPFALPKRAVSGLISGASYLIPGRRSSYAFDGPVENQESEAEEEEKEERGNLESSSYREGRETRE